MHASCLNPRPCIGEHVVYLVTQKRHDHFSSSLSFSCNAIVGRPKIHVGDYRFDEGGGEGLSGRWQHVADNRGALQRGSGQE